VEVRIRLPRIPTGAISNLVGLAGIIAMVVAIGGLTGNIWWSVLAGGAAALVLAVLAQLAEETADEAAPVQPVRARAS